MRPSVEKRFEEALFATRWLVAPIYVGLVFCLMMLLFIFVRYLIKVASQLADLTVHQAVLATLSFIDVALIANLVLIVIFSGYENFVSKMDVDEHVDRPYWMGKVDFAGMKLKLFASIVAITGIELLKAFMAVREDGASNPATLRWLVIIHVTFLGTTVLSAFSEWLTARAKTAVMPDASASVRRPVSLDQQ